MQANTKEELERANRWVELSRLVTKKGPEILMMHIQDLGSVDLQLIRMDRKIIDGLSKVNSGNQAENLEHSILLADTLALSRLWILGAYEALRIIKNQNKSSEGINSIYESYRRLRIPLAKIEAASGYSQDEIFAYPLIHREKGVAWMLNKKFSRSRRALADSFLSLISVYDSTTTTD